MSESVLIGSLIEFLSENFSLDGIILPNLFKSFISSSFPEGLFFWIFFIVLFESFIICFTSGFSFYNFLLRVLALFLGYILIKILKYLKL